MRILTSLAAVAALAASTTPAMAQSTGERILRGVLDSLLQEEEQPSEDEAVEAETETPVTMEQVLAHSRRGDDGARDRYRHPAETLDFFGVEPGMTVADFMPAGGWYSRVLIPYLGGEGTYIGVDPWLNDRFGDYWDRYRNTPERFPREAGDWVAQGGAQVLGVTTDEIPDELHGTVDRFLIFREIHNIRRFDWTFETMAAIRTLLNDDGLVGVVQHQARSNAPVDETYGDKGYQHQADVIALFELHGFELVATSPVNNNRADPSDWEIGVWTLPPNFVGTPENDEDRRAYLQAIGESDRMTLLFRKRQ